MTLTRINTNSITDGSIVNADINTSAAIAGTKISPDFGSQTIATTGIVSHALGTAGAPTVTFTGDTNTGIYSPGADQFAITTGGSGRVFVDSSGRVGLGTSGPQAELNVAKVGGASTVYIESDAGNNATTSILRFGGASGRSASIQGFRGASSNIHSLDFYTYNSADVFGMRLTSTGLGIGSTSFSGNSGTRLVLHDATSPRLRLTNSTTGEAASDGGEISLFGSDLIIENRESAATLFYTGGSERFRCDSSGRLLVGTSSSFANADVDDLVIGNNSSATKTGISLGSTDQSGIAFGDASDARAGLIEYTHSLDALRFYTNGAANERLRFASNGAWGLAGANYGSSGQVLTSNGSGSAPTWQAAASPAALSTASGSAPSYSARAWVNFNGTSTVSIRASGNVSSITDNGIGQFVVNFTNAMPDANYSVVASAGSATTGVSDSAFGHLHIKQNTSTALQSGSVALHSGYADSTNVDYPVNTVAIFR
jgi:hypothetical protein